MAAGERNKQETVEEKLVRLVNAALDAREQRSREEKDPKARFDRVMGRLEAFLDGLEDGGDDGDAESGKGTRRSSGGDGGGDIVKTLFG